MKLVTYPDKILKTKCTPFFGDDEELGNLIETMKRVMKEGDGIGLAANQVGVSKRLFLMNVEGKLRVVINPTINKRSNEMVIMKEGCLSFPGKTFKVRRAAEIRVTYFNERWEEKVEDLGGLESVCFQHECLPSSSVVITPRGPRTTKCLTDIGDIHVGACSASSPTNLRLLR